MLLNQIKIIIPFLQRTKPSGNFSNSLSPHIVQWRFKEKLVNIHLCTIRACSGSPIKTKGSLLPKFFKNLSVVWDQNKSEKVTIPTKEVKELVLFKCFTGCCI